MQRFDKSVVFYWKRQDMMTTTQHRNEMGQSVIRRKQSLSLQKYVVKFQ